MRAQFDELAAELTKKYGSPATQKLEPREIDHFTGATLVTEKADSTWIANDTAIELHYVYNSHESRMVGGISSLTHTLKLVYSDRAAVSPNL